MAFVNSAGNVILQVDNTTSDPAPGPFSEFGRNTLMMISNEPFAIGTLVAMDALHMPFGVSLPLLASPPSDRPFSVQCVALVLDAGRDERDGRGRRDRHREHDLAS
jgi:hypothetical protein